MTTRSARFWSVAGPIMGGWQAANRCRLKSPIRSIKSGWISFWTGGNTVFAVGEAARLRVKPWRLPANWGRNPAAEGLFRIGVQVTGGEGPVSLRGPPGIYLEFRLPERSSKHGLPYHGASVGAEGDLKFFRRELLILIYRLTLGRKKIKPIVPSLSSVILKTNRQNRAVPSQGLSQAFQSALPSATGQSSEDDLR